MEEVLIFKCEHCGEEVFADYEYALYNDWGVVSWRENLERMHRMCEIHASEYELSRQIKADSYESVRALLNKHNECPDIISQMVWDALCRIPKKGRALALASFLAWLWEWFPEDEPIRLNEIKRISPDRYMGEWLLVVDYED